MNTAKHIVPKLLTIQAAAELLDVKTDTLRRWIYARKIGVVRRGQKYVRVPMDEVERFILENYSAPIGDGKVLEFRKR